MFDIHIIDLFDSKQQVCGRGELVGGAGNEGGNGADGVKSIHDINETILISMGRFTRANLHGFSDGAYVVNDVTVSNRDV